MPDTILAAEFTAGSKRRPPMLAITRLTPASGSREYLEEIRVIDRREARKIAAERGVKPWNF